MELNWFRVIFYIDNLHMSKPIVQCLRTDPGHVIAPVIACLFNRAELAAMNEPVKFVSEWIVRGRKLKDGQEFSPTLPYRTFNKESEFGKMEQRSGRVTFPNLHSGQVKLLLNEIEFLAWAQRVLGQQCLKKYTVIYVGAADGKHIRNLHMMFPESTFDLYDSRDFDPDLVEYAKTHRITFFQRYFTKEDAHEYRQKDVIFMCDMRATDHFAINEQTNMTRKDDDHYMQKEWVEIMKCPLAMLKFAPTYGDHQFPYLDGPIRTQPYMPVKSSESRLIVIRGGSSLQPLSNMGESFPPSKSGYPERVFDTKEFEDIGYYYNCVTRSHFLEDPTWSIVIDGKRYVLRPGPEVNYDAIRFFMPGLMRIDEWRGIEICIAYLLTRMASADSEGLPGCAFDEFRGVKINVNELINSAITLMGKIYEDILPDPQVRYKKRIGRD
jgi:hypothetical protein